ncbi:MAG: NTP/NDP exchange transporter [Chlamydiota bacterium]
MTTTTQEFGKWRSKLWPVHRFELKKLLPMALLFFFILFVYTILRDTKDTLVVTAAKGSQVIPFLKFWGTMPCAILITVIYAKLSNKLSKPALFYSMVIPFLAFFALFATVLYPLRDSLHPTQLCDQLQTMLPQGFQGLIDILRNWTFSIFYIMSELWGSLALSLLFWQFANDTTKVSESKRFYMIFVMFANISMIASGRFIKWASKIRESMTSADPWQISLNYLTIIVVVSGGLIIGLYWWINKYILTDSRFYSPEDQKKVKKEKPKLSMKESFLMLVRSKYLGCIALLVLSYGIAINLVEVTWKNQLHHQYPNMNDYSTFMGGLSEKTGIVTILATFFLSGNFVRRFGWGKTALVTPLLLLITGIGFFAFVIFQDNLSGIVAMIGTSPLAIAVLFGLIQNVCSKSAKYSFFDPTKEMSYIPLDQEQKVKGKAAVDVVGARLGKSGGSIIQQGFLALFGTIAAIAPYVAGTLFVIIGIWIATVRSLNKQFLKLTKKPEEGDKKIKEAEPVAKVSNTGAATTP